MEIEKMEERARALHKHVEENPKDYQAVIAELILHSRIIDKQRKNRANERLREVARIRRMINEKHGQ